MNLHLPISTWTALILFSVAMPLTGKAAWVQKAPYGGTAKHRCSGFSIGNKGYIGLGHTNSGTIETFNDFWEYDPATNSWTQIADFGGGYRYHATSFTIGDYGYVGLGENDIGEYKKDLWKYIPLINTWVQVAVFPGTERRGACAFVIDNIAYVGTGQTGTGYGADFYSYDAGLNTWDTIAPFIGQARSSAIAFSHDAKGYVGTGHVLGNDTNDFYQYDPMTDNWLQKAYVGGPSRQDATAFVVSGEAYVGTGNDVAGEENFKDFWKYNFTADTWTEVAEFDGLGRRYLVSFVIGNVAYCGTGTDGTNLRDFWAFYPLLSLDEVGAEKIICFPNPASEFMRIETGDHPMEKGTRIIIFNSSGQLAAEHLASANFTDVPVDQLEQGVYTFLITSPGGTCHQGKFIVSR